MPWIDVDEPFSAPPRSTGPMVPPGDAVIVDVDERWGTISGAEVSGAIDVSRCERLELDGSILRGVSLIATPGLELDVRACLFVECDLSALKFSSMISARFEGCKLSGVDLGSGLVRDVEFDRTMMRMSTLRMTELERVSVRDCVLDDVDFYEASLSDVAFPGSELRAVELDKARFRNVDLREATELDVRSGRRFEGCLLTSSQIVPLAHLFAHASGVAIEKADD
jgi:uncharacterized protein YjbI with pentapeptide repeats